MYASRKQWILAVENEISEINSQYQLRKVEIVTTFNNEVVFFGEATQKENTTRFMDDKLDDFY